MIMKYKNARIQSATVNLTVQHNFENNILKLNYGEFYEMLVNISFEIRENHLAVKRAVIFSY